MMGAGLTALGLALGAAEVVEKRLDVQQDVVNTIVDVGKKITGVLGL